MFITTIFSTPIYINASVQIVSNTAHEIWSIINLYGFAMFAHSLVPPIEIFKVKNAPSAITHKGAS